MRKREVSIQFQSHFCLETSWYPHQPTSFCSTRMKWMAEREEESTQHHTAYILNTSRHFVDVLRSTKYLFDVHAWQMHVDPWMKKNKKMFPK